MPSLVKKWQSIQKELDEEEKTSSSDEDRDQLNKKSIEDWKQQQILTYVCLTRLHDISILFSVTVVKQFHVQMAMCWEQSANTRKAVVHVISW